MRPRPPLVARQYSSSDGNKNNRSNINGVTTTVTTKCVVSLGGCAPHNAVVVLEAAPTKTFFAGLLGIPAFTIKAKATASMRGGTPKPAHVMIVLDRTGSMSTACTAGGTKLDCAKNGLKAFLGAMDPAYDQVGLVAFAPHNGNVCNTPKGTNGPTTDYDAFPNGYQFVPLSTNYKTSATSPLVSSSPLVSTIDCIKAGGTTVFAAAIDKARQVLAANHDPEAQDVMIFMTDGEANYGAVPVPERFRRLLEQHLGLPDEPVQAGRDLGRPGHGAGRLGLRHRLRHAERGLPGLEGHRHQLERRHVCTEERLPVRVRGSAGDHRQHRGQGDRLR